MLALLALAASYTLGGWTAHVPGPVYFNITKQAGTPPAMIVLQTRDGTAIAGSDYSAETITIDATAPGFTSQRIAIPTLTDPKQQGQTLHMSASLSINGVKVATAGATIIQPAMLTCSDGSVILATAKCPLAWVPAPLVLKGFARAVEDCPTTSWGSGIAAGTIGKVVEFGWTAPSKTVPGQSEVVIKSSDADAVYVPTSCVEGVVLK